MFRAMKIATLLPALLLVAAAAQAQDKPRAVPARQGDSASAGASAPRPSFARNEAASRALFDRLDKNKDGYLTGNELTSPEAQTANWLSVDRDADGRISRSEFTAIGSGEIAATPRP
ncbi:MAG: EF-hand domain-containing protein [Betaproteobacteria bacterium]|nr:MAG: EF-hand domain-containing protein [Betaproteobacteria bacterium]